MFAALKINEEIQKNAVRNAGAVYDLQARRTVLVVGGVDGVGAAICKKMADLGHFVAATYHNEKQARAWQDSMEREGYLFFIYKYEGSCFAESQTLVNDVIADLGPIQILINADINGVDSVSHVMHAAVEGMLASGFGRIVNISSKDKNSLPSRISRQGIKKSIHGLTKALARKVASKGITVNTISSGHIAANMILSMPKNMLGNIEAQIPVGRLGRAEDIAQTVSFLVSEESAFINGANIAASGGYIG